MASILAVTWDGGGNVAPMLEIARELCHRGHRVRVLGHPHQRDTVTRAGMEFISYDNAPAWSPGQPATGLKFLLKFLFLVFINRGIEHDTRAALTREPVDLALVDSMTLGALRAVEHARVPTSVLMHTFHHYHTHAWSRGPIGVVAALKGMRPSRLWNSADRVLVATDRELDPAKQRRLPVNVRHTGVAQAPARPAAPSAKPLILISLSTLYFEGQSAALQAIVDAVAQLPVRAVVTAGAIPLHELSTPPDMEVHHYLPHEEIMPKASLVIGHGGHSTTMRALAHDLPLLILPVHPMLDQPMIGKAVADVRAGLVLPKTARPDEIRAAVRTLLDNPTHRAAAATIGRRIREHNGTIAAANELETLLTVTGTAAGPTA
jgi:UDP:flavonoid glycosyltransferase YjiC (YdhE family)